jgi:glutathione S-transferase
VPLLVLDNGEQLTEGVAIVQYLADRKPEAKPAPRNGTFERVHLQEWLNYISTEIHKSFSPPFHPEPGEKTQEYFRQNVRNAFDFVSEALKGRQYLLGNQQRYWNIAPLRG